MTPCEGFTAVGVLYVRRCPTLLKFAPAGLSNQLLMRGTLYPSVFYLSILCSQLLVLTRLLCFE